MRHICFVIGLGTLLGPLTAVAQGGGAAVEVRDDVAPATSGQSPAPPARVGEVGFGGEEGQAMPEGARAQQVGALERRLQEQAESIRALQAALDENAAMLRAMREDTAAQATERRVLEESAVTRGRLASTALTALERMDREIYVGESDEATADALFDARALLQTVAAEAASVGSVAEQAHAARSLEALAQAETALNNRDKTGAQALVAQAWLETRALALRAR